jgi:hypothetical protein
LNNAPEASYAWGSFGAWFTAHFTPRAPPSTQISPNDPAAKLIASVRDHPLLRNGPNDLPSYLTAASFATALLTALRDGSSLPVFAQAERTVNGLPDGDLKTILTGFIVTAGGDLDKLHTTIERWFDAEMDRLSGLYKRAALYMMLVIGAILVVALNVNTLHLAKTLWADAPVERAALVATANNVIAAQSNADEFVQRIDKSLTTLDRLDLPIGWSTAPVTAPKRRSYLVDILSTIFGWLLTLFAITLGAPFWFDMGQNFVDLRNAGPKPASTTSNS